MRILLLAAVAALALPACRPAGDAAKSGEAMARSGAPAGGPTGKSGDPVAKGAENVTLPPVRTMQGGPPPPPPPSPLPTNIPKQFRGRWGLNAADCQGGAAAKGLLTIDDSRLVFYESRGVLDRIDSNDPSNRLVANFGYRGEGMTWQRVERLTLSGGKLERRPDPIADSGEPAQVLTYMRCPNRADSR